jgi:hypothetical protein
LSREAIGSVPDCLTGDEEVELFCTCGVLQAVITSSIKSRLKLFLKSFKSREFSAVMTGDAVL